MRIIFLFFLFTIYSSLLAQEQFRLDFQYYKKFTTTPGKNKNGTNKGYWGENIKENNSFVFNYNSHKDIAFFAPNSEKIIYIRDGEPLESELSSGKKYSLIIVTNPDGIYKVLQYFEDGLIRIVDDKGMIEFTTEEMNLVENQNLFLYDTLKIFKITGDKSDVPKIVSTPIMIKQTSDKITVDTGSGEVEYIISEKIDTQNSTDNEKHFDCYKKRDKNDTYLFSFFKDRATMINDTESYLFLKNK